MYDKSLEPLSAMMDGEIEEFELRRVVERVSDEQALKQKWQRYHLVQDVMQGRDIKLTEKVDLVSKVSAALDDEAVFTRSNIEENKSDTAQQVTDAKQWWKPFASMAVAASVTAVVLLGAQQYNNDLLPSVPSNQIAGTMSLDDTLPQSRFGNELSTVSAPLVQPEAVRNAYGMESYIQKHHDLVSKREANWQVNWLPQGYQEVEHRVTSTSEVLLYTNGESAVSINIEPIGTQVASQGVLGTDELLAYGVRAGKNFVTVVGQVTPQVAARIAESISVVNR